MDIAAHFGENLARCRRAADLSQEELGVRASLHRTEIGKLERGTRVARVDTLVKLAGALSIPPSELIDGIGWTPGGTQTGEFHLTETRPAAGGGGGLAPQAGLVSPTRSA